MTDTSPLQTIGTPDAATPEAMAILSSVPGIATVVRDDRHRAIRCNPLYAANTGLSAEELVGTTHRDLRPGDAADERVELMRRVIDEHKARDFLQFWNGRSWLCRIIPLDHEAFGTRGTLSVSCRPRSGRSSPTRGRSWC
jgi:PAS domain-containing protein